ncbi:Na+/H+ antiporter NhaA [Kineococcus sp. NUM-3379]
MTRVRSLGTSDTAGAAVMLAAAAAAVVWANLPGESYAHFWHTPVGISVAGSTLELSLQHWVNDALMALFFFQVSLEVKREFALGELRDRRRARVPVTAALVGLAVPAAVFLAVGWAGDAPPEVRGAWGVVISTDTAFVLGLLAVAGTAVPPALRVFLLTLAVVDDVGALAVVAVVYTERLDLVALAGAALGLGGILLLRRLRVWRGPAYLFVSVLVWLAVLASGVHATVAGVAIGLLMPVYPPKRSEVERSERRVQAFGRSPTPERARTAVLGITRAVSVNERLHHLFHPYVSLLVVPVFALANAGVRLDAESLRAAAGSALTWGIVAGLVAGKLIGICAGTALSCALRLGRLAPGLAARHVAAGGLLSGVGFTISLFIVDLALTDPALQAQARIGVLAASLAAAVLGALALSAVRAVDRARAPERQHLLRPVDPGRDHVRGPVEAPTTLLVYASFAFDTAGRTVEVVEEVLRCAPGSLRFVFRHLPSGEPVALEAARAAEAAAEQGRFWPMHDALAVRSGRLDSREIRRCAAEAGLNLDRLEDAVRHRRHEARILDDAVDAETMCLEEPPRFFVNGELYDGPVEVGDLLRALTTTGGDRLAPSPP